MVQGNAIAITAQQYNHEMEKDQREKNQGRALGRVKQELSYVGRHLTDFMIEEGEYSDRFTPVDNDLGLDLKADNGDIHQQYLDSESIALSSPSICKWRVPFCKKYALYGSLNTPIAITGTIKYENPTICQYPSGECAQVPVKNHLVYLSVRSYDYTIGKLCFGMPEGLVVPTIKTILYPFQTDENGNISGVIYAAAPWDQGMPYIEYVDTRSQNVDAVTLAATGTDNTYQQDFTPYGIKPSNSIFYPAICAMSDTTTIDCYAQYFDQTTYTLSLDVVYKQMYEPRTFFFGWEHHLSTVSNKWGSWSVGDTCLPLRAAWVTNWDEVCATHSGCRSYCLFDASAPDCNADIFTRTGAYPRPSIFIRAYGNNETSQEIKWASRLPFHETGHWLYFLMQGKYLPDSTGLAGSKCALGDTTTSGTLSEAFAESHIFEFLLVRSTGYGDYDLASGGEVNIKCEDPIGSPSSPPPAGWTDCVRCGNCADPVKDSPIMGHDCHNYYIRSCTDTNHAPCHTGVVSTQASFLRDVYDNVNSLYYDDFGADTIFMPLASIYHCFIDNAIGKIPGDRMMNFIDILENRCGASPTALATLQQYFFSAP